MASIICLVGGWLKTGVTGDLAMCLITQQASLRFFTWWQSQASQDSQRSHTQCVSAFKASACITFANDLLA